MDVCYLLVYVQEIRIQPYFCVKQGRYFFPLIAKDPVVSLGYPTITDDSKTLSKEPVSVSCRVNISKDSIPIVPWRLILPSDGFF